MDELETPAAVEQPRGIFTGVIDDKGRLKLPAAFQDFLNALGETKVFCTSFDERIARLYPISKWKEIETLLKSQTDDAEAAEDLWFTAMDLGGDAVMDGQGRLLIPAELRRTLKIEGQPVFLEHYKGHIKVFGKEIYDQRKQRSRQNNGEKLQRFEKKGLQ